LHLHILMSAKNVQSKELENQDRERIIQILLTQIGDVHATFPRLKETK